MRISRNFSTAGSWFIETLLKRGQRRSPRLRVHVARAILTSDMTFRGISESISYGIAGLYPHILAYWSLYRHI